MKTQGSRLIIVSNRLPIVLTQGENGQWSIKPGSGGLVTALVPILRNRGGVWIGWSGMVEEENVDLGELLADATKKSGYTLRPVSLTAEEKSKFYHGFSNEIIWPLFHDLQSRCNFDPTYWLVYQSVNHKFARVIAENIKENDFIWVHDYHLMNVAKELRAMGVTSKIGFFLHIPFPPLDIFIKLPWRFQVLHALLEYDTLGFQTLRDRHNFVQCLRILIRDITLYGKGQILTGRIKNREVRIGSFPISIDYRAFAKQAASQEVCERARCLREALLNCRIILGVDRLDYTKGIPERLKAFRNALIRFPDLHRKVTLVQIVVPSRVEIPEYSDLKVEIERLVSEINGQFTQPGWVPIHYIFRSLERTELLAYYRAADIALVTPLKDGMNLVAKEYCACSIYGDDVLILSEFAGAAVQLQKGALLVNPYDIEGVAEAIYRAVNMSQTERRSRMRKLRRSIREQDIFWWVDSFLQASIAQHLDDFPPLEGYVPLDDYLPQVELE
ncbi:MAG TPA: trehalose-6-phosphate synthase [Candidatus Limnocylindrales bacterium]|nr:trehalose-6-phosphate synthase [Candidatus Limnocylindrales bacterium]